MVGYQPSSGGCPAGAKSGPETVTFLPLAPVDVYSMAWPGPPCTRDFAGKEVALRGLPLPSAGVIPVPPGSASAR